MVVEVVGLWKVMETTSLWGKSTLCLCRQEQSSCVGSARQGCSPVSNVGPAALFMPSSATASSAAVRFLS